MDIMHLVERSLYFFVDNSHFVIQVTIFVIIVLVVLYLFNLIVSGNESNEGLSKKDISELEMRIKTVLEQASTVTANKTETDGEGAGSDAAASEQEGASAEQAAASKEVLEQIETLKKEVEKKEVELNELKEGSSAGGGLSEEESKNYMDKINELEAKLQEYEIIEDEIADLSHFKEENERLKKQLEEIQGGAGSASAATEPAAEEEASDKEEATAEEEPVQEENKNEQADGEATEQSNSDAEDSKKEEPKTEETGSENDGDDLMAQASAMLGDQAEEEKPAQSDNENNEEPNDKDAEAEAEQMLSGSEAEEEEFITKDFIEDFDKAVKEDVYGIKEEDSGEKQEEPKADESSADEDVQKQEEPESTDESNSESDSEEESAGQEVITDDLLAEFSQQLEPELNAQVEETEKHAKDAGGEEEPVVEDATASEDDAALIDTEKMMQEMEELKDLPDDDTSISALEEDTDIEKMANEATKLSSDS